MNFEISHNDKATVFKVTNKKLDANISGLLKAEINSLITKNNFNKMIFELSEVESCDSSGLSVLLVANRIMNDNNGKLIICGLRDKIMTLIKITQLDVVLNIASNQNEAMLRLSK